MVFELENKVEGISPACFSDTKLDKKKQSKEGERFVRLIYGRVQITQRNTHGI